MTLISTSVDALIESDASPAGSREDSRDLCRNLILAERTVSFRTVQRAAERLGLHVSKHLFADVHRELAARVAGPAQTAAPTTNATAVSAAAPVAAPADLALEAMRRESAALDFAVEHLTAHPNGSIDELRVAAESARHMVTNEVYGKARALTGSPVPVPATAVPVATAPTMVATATQPRGSMTAPRRTDLDLGDLLDRVRWLQRERDQLQRRLDRIGREARALLRRA